MTDRTLPTRRLGANGPDLSAIGLGCMGMSDFYGPADEATSRATIDAALDAGITLFDTGDFYGSGHNEMLLGSQLKGRRDRAFIQVKMGALRDPAGGFVGFDLRPGSIRNYLAMTLKRLGTDYVDLYMPARVDPAVPIEDVVGTIAELVQAGWVRHIGLSEAGADTLRRAHRIHPITALQFEYGLLSRGIEDKILPTARELGIGVTAYGVLSRGLLAGTVRPGSLGQHDFRSHSPRFQGAALDHNLGLAERLAELAAARSLSPAQLAIAWVLARGDDIIPLVGARRPDRLAEALGALDHPLDPATLAAIEAAIPRDAAQGERYPRPQMALLDSERRSEAA